MSKMNLYKIHQEKSSDFISEVSEKFTLKCQKTVVVEKIEYNFVLFTYFSEENNKQLTWNWMLNEFGEEPVRLTSNPKAVVVVTKDEAMYVISFGAAHFIVDKYCDRTFAFEFAKRSKYTKIKTTAMSAPNLPRNRTINSYKNCTDFIYDSGESFQKIKASITIPEDESRFNGSIEIGTSIKFSMKENTLVNIIKILEYVEEIASQEVLHKIPLFVEVPKERIPYLDAKLVTGIKEKKADIRFSNFNIIGVDETFYRDDAGYKIIYKKRAISVDELSSDVISEFIENNKIPDEEILRILIEIESDENIPPILLKRIIDYTDDSEKAVIQDGIWYEYNDDYLKYLSESLEEIQVVHDEKYDSFQEEYLAYLETKYEEEKSSAEYSGKEEKFIRTSIRTKFYRERVFNILRGENDGFVNGDREIDSEGGYKYEKMDLYKDKTIYAVKIGNASSKLSYALDQSIVAVKMMKDRKSDLEVDIVGVWIILERAKKLKENDGKIDLNDLDMLMLKNRIDAWKKEVRHLGYKPLIRLNYILT